MTGSRLALVLATSVVLAGITACAAGTPAPTTAPAPTATATASRTPTPTPEAAGPPLGGDCTQALDLDALAPLLQGDLTFLDSSSLLVPHIPDPAAAVSALGGLSCSWQVSAGPAVIVGVQILPVASVGDAAATAAQAFACSHGSCSQATVRGSSWVQATAVNRASDQMTPTDEQQRALGELTQAMLDGLAAMPVADLAGPTADKTGWWASSCTPVEDAVTEAAGLADPLDGYPSDSNPGMAPAGPVALGGAVGYCAWHVTDTVDGSDVVEVALQPGSGAPTADQLAAVGATPVEVAGADAAYLITSDALPLWGRRLIAVSGVNRLSVGGADPVAVAEAALAVLNG